MHKGSAKCMSEGKAAAMTMAMAVARVVSSGDVVAAAEVEVAAATCSQSGTMEVLWVVAPTTLSQRGVHGFLAKLALNATMLVETQASQAPATRSQGTIHGF